MASYRYHRAQVADGDSAVRDKDRHIPKCCCSIIPALVLAWSASPFVTCRGVLLLVPGYSRIWGLFGARCGRISYFKRWSCRECVTHVGAVPLGAPLPVPLGLINLSVTSATL